MRIYGHGIRRRTASMLGGDGPRLRMAWSLLFSLPGTPVMLYGDEIGMVEDLAARGPDERAHADALGRSSPSRSARPTRCCASCAASPTSAARRRSWAGASAR